MVVKRSARKVSAKRSTKGSTKGSTKRSTKSSTKRSNKKVGAKVNRLLTAVKVRKGKNSAVKRVRVVVVKKQLSNRKETKDPVDVNDLILEINGLAFAADDNNAGVFLTDKYTVSQLKSRLERLRKKHGAVPRI